MLFKNLSLEQEGEFRAWARENYKPLEPIKGVWHPVIQDECVKMNIENQNVVIASVNRKTPEFTEAQLEYLNGLLNGDLINEIWKKENADDRNRMDFRTGQRDGIRMAMRAIHVDQEQLKTNCDLPNKGGAEIDNERKIFS